MSIPLIPVEILSIYFDKDKQRGNLFKRLAQCTPDTKAAVMSVKAELDAMGITFFLSDMFSEPKGGRNPKCVNQIGLDWVMNWARLTGVSETKPGRCWRKPACRSVLRTQC